MSLIQSTPMSEAEFDVLKVEVFKHCGVKINAAKKIFLQSRLQRRLTYCQCPSFTDYIQYLKANPTELTEFVNVVTTNTTHFFREIEHFQFVQNVVVPEWIQNFRFKPFFAWSAASSSGEEAFSLAVVLSELGSVHGFDYRILGTDISTEVLDKAKAGIYRDEQLQAGFSEHLKQKYLQRGVGKNAGLFRFIPELQRNIKFRHFNLIEDKLPLTSGFDLILLRNVLIYFSKETTQKVVDNVTQYLKPGGYIVFGLSENLNEINHNLTSLGHSIYKREYD